LEQTGFTTTFGLSVNPFLAKIASGLRKPGTVNLLYPWCCQTLLAAMPCRKLPGLGRSMMKALQPCLEREHHPANDNDGMERTTTTTLWTCRHLMQVPLPILASALQPVVTDAWKAARKLVEQCHGRDDTPVIDDDGMPQTVSCENSFRRGFLRTIPAVQQQVMPDLYRRLPRLVQERTTWSHNPALAYPRTLRVTIRCAHSSSSQHYGKQRRSVTSSKQTPVDGKRLIQASLAEQSELLQKWVAPILAFLLSGFGTSLNVTRVNIALANFPDIGAQVPSRERPANPFLLTTQTSQTNRNLCMKEAKSIQPRQQERSIQVSRFKSSHDTRSPSSCSSSLPPAKRNRIDQYFAPKAKR